MKNIIVTFVIIAGLIGGFVAYNHAENERTKLQSQLKEERKVTALEQEKRRAELERENKKAEFEQEKRRAEFEQEKKRVELEQEKRKEQEQKAKNASLLKLYARRAGEKLIKMVHPVLGGQDLLVEVASWEYDKYNDEFSAKIDIYWNGAVFSSNRYNATGMLTCDHAGNNAKFTRTYANQQLIDYETTTSWIKVLFAVAVVLGSLNE
jgi:hypothetical protein